MKRSLSAWYAGLLWNLCLLFLGSIAATAVVTAPFLTFWMLKYGLETPPSWSTLRAFQVVQGFAVCLTGGWWTERVFRSRFDCPHASTRRWITGFQIATLAGLLVLGAVVAHLHYGSPFTDRELWRRTWISTLLLTATFVPSFVIASRYFWRRYSSA